MYTKTKKRLVKAIQIQNKMCKRLRESVEASPVNISKNYKSSEKSLCKAMNTVRWCLNFSYQNWFSDPKLAKMLNNQL